LGAGLTIQPRKKVTVKNPQGLTWAVEPYDDDELLIAGKGEGFRQSTVLWDKLQKIMVKY
jgi:hypothetical protein